MDPEIKDILEENLELAKENNKMLKTLRSALRWSRIFKAIYWAVIIGSMLGFYYYFQPFIDSIRGAYDDLVGFLGKSSQMGSSTPSISDINRLLRP